MAPAVQRGRRVSDSALRHVREMLTAQVPTHCIHPSLQDPARNRDHDLSICAFHTGRAAPNNSGAGRPYSTLDARTRAACRQADRGVGCLPKPTTERTAQVVLIVGRGQRVIPKNSSGAAFGQQNCFCRWENIAVFGGGRWRGADQARFANWAAMNWSDLSRARSTAARTAGTVMSPRTDQPCRISPKSSATSLSGCTARSASSTSPPGR